MSPARFTESRLTRHRYLHSGTVEEYANRYTMSGEIERRDSSVIATRCSIYSVQATTDIQSDYCSYFCSDKLRNGWLKRAH